MSNIVKITDAEYFERFPVRPRYEIRESETAPRAWTNQQALSTLKKLEPGQMFVLDKKQRNIGSWLREWGKRLGRKFHTRKVSETQTEVHRVY